MVDKRTRIRAVAWRQQRRKLYAIRKAVFVDEQQVPLELELDAEDVSAQHFVAEIGGRAVATARLTQAGQIGRMAVLKPHRGQGIGSALMRAILSYASQAKLKQLYLHAQVQAIPFYNRFGFTATGEPFMEAGIVHQTMERFDHE